VREASRLLQGFRTLCYQVCLAYSSANHSLSDKLFAYDPLLMSVVKQVADLIAPFLTMFKRSVATSQFPAVFTDTFITPIVKKAGMDSADVNSYWLNSKLPVISKVFEHLVALQLIEGLTSADLFSSRQSRFRSQHPTETAILHVLSDIKW
jgi:hypothetical protein